MDAYLVMPPAPARGSVVMLQEIFGVNEAMREKARDFALAGFTVLVPDLFWRIRPRVDLGYSDDERKQGFALMQKFDQVAGAADVRDAIDWLRRRGDSSRKVGLLGFCLGGRIAVLAGAANPDVSAVIAFYGVRLDLCGEQLRMFSAPFQFHVGDRDVHVPADHVKAIGDILAKVPNSEIFIYSRAQHGFFNRLRADVHDPEATKLARSRATRLLMGAA
jgi:carboxymethylenebutenolidase